MVTSHKAAVRLARSADIGQLIADGRRRARLTQAEFGKRLGVSRKTVSDIERGAAEHISLTTALAALWLAGFQLEASIRRPPTLNDVMARRAADIARAEQMGNAEPFRAKRPKR